MLALNSFFSMSPSSELFRAIEKNKVAKLVSYLKKDSGDRLVFKEWLSQQDAQWVKAHPELCLKTFKLLVLKEEDEAGELDVKIASLFKDSHLEDRLLKDDTFLRRLGSNQPVLQTLFEGLQSDHLNSVMGRVLLANPELPLLDFICSHPAYSDKLKMLLLSKSERQRSHIFLRIHQKLDLEMDSSCERIIKFFMLSGDVKEPFLSTCLKTSSRFHFICYLVKHHHQAIEQFLITLPHKAQGCWAVNFCEKIDESLCMHPERENLASEVLNTAMNNSYLKKNILPIVCSKCYLGLLNHLWKSHPDLLKEQINITYSNQGRDKRIWVLQLCRGVQRMMHENSIPSCNEILMSLIGKLATDLELKGAFFSIAKDKAEFYLSYCLERANLESHFHFIKAWIDSWFLNLPSEKRAWSIKFANHLASQLIQEPQKGEVASFLNSNHSFTIAFIENLIKYNHPSLSILFQAYPSVLEACIEEAAERPGFLDRLSTVIVILSSELVRRYPARFEMMAKNFIRFLSHKEVEMKLHLETAIYSHLSMQLTNFYLNQVYSEEEIPIVLRFIVSQLSKTLSALAGGYLEESAGNEKRNWVISIVKTGLQNPKLTHYFFKKCIDSSPLLDFFSKEPFIGEFVSSYLRNSAISNGWLSVENQLHILQFLSPERVRSVVRLLMESDDNFEMYGKYLEEPRTFFFCGTKQCWSYRVALIEVYAKWIKERESELSEYYFSEVEGFLRRLPPHVLALVGYIHPELQETILSCLKFMEASHLSTAIPLTSARFFVKAVHLLPKETWFAYLKHSTKEQKQCFIEKIDLTPIFSFHLLFKEKTILMNLKKVLEIPGLTEMTRLVKEKIDVHLDRIAKMEESQRLLVKDETPCSDFIDPISGVMMKNPVSDPYGHNYERESINRWLVMNPTSPINRQPLTVDQLKPNFLLKTKIVCSIGTKEEHCRELKPVIPHLKGDLFVKAFQEIPLPTRLSVVGFMTNEQKQLFFKHGLDK